MMTYEEYTQRVENILQQMRESKIEEGKAKVRAIEECNMEHLRLKMEMHSAIQMANIRRRKKIDEIHDLFVEQRNRLYAQHNKLINEWREQNGISPRPQQESGNRSVGDETSKQTADGAILPPPYVELPEERPNEIGG